MRKIKKLIQFFMDSKEQTVHIQDEYKVSLKRLYYIRFNAKYQDSFIF